MEIDREVAFSYTTSRHVAKLGTQRPGRRTVRMWGRAE